MEWVQVSNRATVLVPPERRWDAVQVPRVEVVPLPPKPLWSATLVPPRPRFLCDLQLPVDTPHSVLREFALKLHML